jgi:hypothetical protein
MKECNNLLLRFFSKRQIRKNKVRMNAYAFLHSRSAAIYMWCVCRTIVAVLSKDNHKEKFAKTEFLHS